MYTLSDDGDSATYDGTANSNGVYEICRSESRGNIKVLKQGADLFAVKSVIYLLCFGSVCDIMNIHFRNVVL